MESNTESVRDISAAWHACLPNCPLALVPKLGAVLAQLDLLQLQALTDHLETMLSCEVLPKA